MSMSIIKAELREIHAVIKKVYSTEQLLQDIQLNLRAGLIIHCDNLQTIQLIIKEND